MRVRQGDVAPVLGDLPCVILLGGHGMNIYKDQGEREKRCHGLQSSVVLRENGLGEMPRPCPSVGRPAATTGRVRLRVLARQIRSSEGISSQLANTKVLHGNEPLCMALCESTCAIPSLQ